MKKLVTVYEVIADGKGEGPAGDGTHIHRFKLTRDAEAFAARNTYYGRPAHVQTAVVSKQLAARWCVS